MATVYDVAAYILKRKGRMTAMKLQKLVYYSQAWSLVWDEEPLFSERIEAWSNGPVVPVLYRAHRGAFKVHSVGRGNPDNLTPNEKETIRAVLRAYGNKPAQWLSDLTHEEPPWRDTRKGLGPGDRSVREITHAAMVDFYSAPF